MGVGEGERGETENTSSFVTKVILASHEVENGRVSHFFYFME